MAYPFNDIEKKWQKFWADHKTFRAENRSDKPKYYVLDMFPYPSGAGLHVGHPLGYIASDIVARYKRLKGFNVLHPMGYDSFGLPAEQYAIQTGQHPEKTTRENIARYREQMDKIGFSFDWDREVRTSDPKFYKWTQWIFLKLFNSWYNPETDKAEPIETLIPKLKNFTGLSEKEKNDVLMEYRLAYLSEAWVNWCPQLGTVLANEEVKDGVSERGGYPVERKLMPQWSLRITAYAARLLNDLDGIDWSESIKESQRNWIGKSEGSSLKFQIADSKLQIEVFTTRPDTIYGVTFLTLAPESDLVPQLTTAENKKAVDEYVNYAKNRSERERQADVKKVTGQFTGAYAIHPFSGEKLPIWIGDYVLAGYGTGAVMGVPAHDSRDHAFAKQFGLPVKQVVAAPDGWDFQKESFDAKEGKCINSDLINGLEVKDALKKIIAEIEKRGLGKGKTQFRLRDAIFGRQRYWGEPIPIYYENGIPKPLPENELPLVLPEVDKYLPTESGEPPLARAKDWKYKDKFEYEKTTMPGWAGSSWYFLRYMVENVKHILPENDKAFADQKAIDYWQNVDLYIGGSEHATGHLLYVRFWTKFLFDLGFISVAEPAKKLINQGMIQGVSYYTEEIKIHRKVKAEYEKDKRAKELRIYKSGNLLCQIPLPYHEQPDGHAIYKNYGCQLGIKMFLQGTNEEIPLDSVSLGLSKAYWVKEVSVNSEVISAHTLKERWLKVEQHYNPIVVTDFPINAFWHYEDNLRKEGDNNDVWRELSSDKKIIDTKSPIPLWTCKAQVEKMSKSRYNVITPDNQPFVPAYGLDVKAAKENKYWKEEESYYVFPGVIEQFGTDCLRLYEMFLGPLEQSKPWSTSGISGVHGFLNRFWRLFHKENPTKNPEERIANPEFWEVSEEAPSKAELKILHKTIKKVQWDIENYSFNTSVSAFMICVNDLTELKCNKRAILEPLTILLAPFAPHIAEELWQKLGHKDSITYAAFPTYNEAFTIDDSFAYPVSFNGKMRFNLELPLTLTPAEIEKEVMAFDQTKKFLEGKQPKKIIVVPKRIVNIVV